VYAFIISPISVSRSAHLIRLHLVTQQDFLKSTYYEASNFCIITGTEVVLTEG